MENSKYTRIKKRFIVLCDFSEASKNLLLLTNSLSLEKGIKILVVHRTLELLPSVGEREMIAKIKKDKRKRILIELKEFVTETIGENTNIKCVVTTGNISELILKRQSPEITDFIFTGIKEKEFLERMLLGSTVVSLSDHTDSIILAVPDNVKLNLKNLNIALIKKYPFNETAFNNLLFISRTIEQLQFFSVIKSGEDTDQSLVFLSQFKDKYAEIAETSANVTTGENTLEAIQDLVSKSGGSLVIQKGSRDFFDLFRSFFVNEAIYQAREPIIILPEKN